MERGFADADHRRGRCAARGLEPGVVEAGDDEGVGVARLADLVDEAWNRERLIEIALDAGRPKVWIDRCDFDAGRSGGLGGGADLQRHRAGGVRIDGVDMHAPGAPGVARE